VLENKDNSVHQVHCALQAGTTISLTHGTCPANKWPATRRTTANSNGNPQKKMLQKLSGRRKLVLKCHLSPGDIVMLTAAVRDLHRAHPNQFVTSVETSASDLWDNNPYITDIENPDSDMRAITMHYPIVNQSNQRPVHFLRGYTEYLEAQLGLRIPTTEFHGDIHVSDAEKSWISQVEEQFGFKGPFWLIFAGGKYDFTAKWWSPAHYQQVVNHFRGRIQFVQCGEANHWHPRLDGVFHLVGKTTLRQLIRLVYHAVGVICPVTLAMHLAAAIPTKTNRLRPCVVIAGGREPPHWEAYPGHQFLHTVGMLPCCATGGCWKSRCQKVGDNDPKDRDNLCERPVPVRDKLVIPQCMAMIQPDAVIRAVENYLVGQTQ
jgi:ADP-heptose:LPS heptosyltransferase